MADPENATVDRRKSGYFLSIWTTDGCFRSIDKPFRCKYCFYGNSTLRSTYKPPRMMSIDTARKVADVINEGWITGVSFFGGEPMCNWDIVHRILCWVNEETLREAAGKPRGSVFNITTNGVHLNKERLKILKDHGVHILLSFDGTRETQNKWRDGSYDEVMKNKEDLVAYPSLSITKTMADPFSYYEDVRHIKELGFKFMFTNYLDPYGIVNYDNYNPHDFVNIYKKTVRDFHGKDGFTMGEIKAWSNLQETNMKGVAQTIGDGFTRWGLGLDPDGYYYQCHQAPSLPDSFRIGDLWNGIDKEKEKELRSVPNAPSCTKCIYKRTQCYVNMYHRNGRFGVDPPAHAMLWERTLLEMYQEITGLPMNKWYACVGGNNNG